MRPIAILAALMLTCGVVHAADKIKPGEAAPTLPMSLLSDGTRFRLEDYRGKVVVFYLYESTCPSCRKLVPERNAWLDTYKGKPVKFVAVGAGDSGASCKSYVTETHLKLPVMADPFSFVEKGWGEAISLQNIYQMKVVDPDGKLSCYTVGDKWFDRAMEHAKWTYNHDDYDPALAPVFDKIEFGDWENGAKLLKLAKKAKKPIAESAAKLAEKLKEEATQWSADAEAATTADPVKAYDLFTRVSQVMDGDPLAKSADEKIRELKKNQTVKDELAARKMYDQLALATNSAAQPAQRTDVINFAKSITKKYPETPTGKEVANVVTAWESLAGK